MSDDEKGCEQLQQINDARICGGGDQRTVLCLQWSGRRGHLNATVTDERSKEKSFPGREGTACAKALR